MGCHSSFLMIRMTQLHWTFRKLIRQGYKRWIWEEDLSPGDGLGGYCSRLNDRWQWLHWRMTGDGKKKMNYKDVLSRIWYWSIDRVTKSTSQCVGAPATVIGEWHRFGNRGWLVWDKICSTSGAYKQGRVAGSWKKHWSFSGMVIAQGVFETSSSEPFQQEWMRIFRLKALTRLCPSIHNSTL